MYPSRLLNTSQSNWTRLKKSDTASLHFVGNTVTHFTFTHFLTIINLTDYISYTISKTVALHFCVSMMWATLPSTHASKVSLEKFKK